jgi:hypothetical protein
MHSPIYDDARERELDDIERRRINVAEMIEREFVDAWIDGTYSKPVMAAVRFKSPGVGFHLGERKFADVFSEMIGTVEGTQLTCIPRRQVARSPQRPSSR